MDVADRLQFHVERATSLLKSTSESASGERPAPGKWCPREVLGHLIDSASVNHGRFVRAQLQDDLVFAGYAQNDWVDGQRYGEAPWKELIQLWRSLNLHLVRVMRATSNEVLTKPRPRHNLHEIAWQPVPEGQATTLEYFFADYVGHLEHHLREVLGPGWADAGL